MSEHKINIDEVVKKWEPVLEHKEAPAFQNTYRRNTTAVLLNNVYENLQEEKVHVPSQMLLEGGVPLNAMGSSSSTAGTGNIDTFDPIMISMVRRAMPVLIPFDIMGVQAMTGPTGLIFCMRSKYANTSALTTETFYNEVNTMFSSVLDGSNTFGQKHVGSIPGSPTQIGNTAETGVYNTGKGMTRPQAEALGSTGNTDFPKMGLTIEKTLVEANTRALASEYTLEMAQDLKNVHGLDARSELIQMLSTEIVAEINREALRTVNFAALIGAQDDCTTPGIFDLDLDSNGRWSVEKWKGLLFQLERERNAIAKSTRRGRGNFVIMSSDAVSALAAAGALDYAPAIEANKNLQIDDTGPSFAGLINGQVRCYIDPYATGGNYMTVGYKGQSPWDAGLIYAPYVPMQLVNAVDPGTFTPKFAFKTRYGMVSNPFAEGLTKGSGRIAKDSNVYYRKVLIQHLM
jgi:hypothetical protein